jgi:hypothetical protein
MDTADTTQFEEKAIKYLDDKDSQITFFVSLSELVGLEAS